MEGIKKTWWTRFLNALKRMWRTGFLNAKTRIIDFIKHASPYRVVAVLSCMFLLFFDIMHTLNDEHYIVFWSVYVGLLAYLCLFIEPGIRKPSHIKLIKWCSLWVLVAMSVGVNQLSLFLSTFASSIVCLLALHFIFKVIQYIFPCKGRKWPDIWTILHVSAVVIVAGCVFLSYCRERPLKRRNLKDKFCSSWLAPACIALSSSYSYTFIGLHIANYVAERSFEVRSGREYRKPDFLDMVVWFPGISVSLYKTFFDVAWVYLKKFVYDLKTSLNLESHFDVRRHQAKMSESEGDYLYDHFSKEKELWFDFMADTGDGGHSTYTVARLLAQPRIKINSVQKEKNKINLDTLERGALLLIGGDLAYPNPSEFNYERRLFRPFHYALQPPVRFHARVTVDKPMVPPEMDKPYNGPQCFVIPGNHDWFDRITTFTRNICHRSWLGGWHMPQKKSYFALKLPMGWWIFGLDLALHNDIDELQFEFFSKLAKETVGEKDSVIIMTHGPDWLLEWYEKVDPRNNVPDYQSRGRNVSGLIHNILKKRCKLRIAGDIHHYMRHSEVSSQANGNNDEPFYVPHLLVNGCGGAFTHPTHVFRDFNVSHGVSYECKAHYPSFEKSRMLAYRNIWSLSEKNWHFDFVGGIIYFVILLVFMLPQFCELDNIFQEDSISGFWSFFGIVWSAFIYILKHVHVLLRGAMPLFIVVVVCVRPKVSFWKQLMIEVLHVLVHLAAALILMLLLEVGIETLVRRKAVETSGYHPLYRWLQAMFHRHLPITIANQDSIKRCIKYLMSKFDVPELMAETRNNICKNGIESISRLSAIIYYAFAFFYFWVLSTPAVSVVVGTYLCICINLFNLHYDEAFSSLRIADYKAFTRFHIKHDGDLEVFTLAVDKVPEEWEQDPQWEEEENSDQLSYLKTNPSQWKAAASDQEPLTTVKIIDNFVIPRTT